MNQAALHQLLMSRKQVTEITTEDPYYEQRLATNLSLISSLFFSLYPESNNAFKKLVSKLDELFKERPKVLKNLDLERLNAGNWYQSEQLVGMQLYVDRFAKDIPDLETKIPYFEKLGVNYLHLMPITTRPKGENDGGYAVNSYHEIDPKYGTKKDFERFTKKARSKNMLLMLDFVVNHTSDEFVWAKEAAAGNKEYQEYYYTFPNRAIPDQYEQTMPEIFPESAPGNFTYNEAMGSWVMTCFNKYQWDLNYKNPLVFIAMLDNLLKLANMGVDVVRFDALAFLWKKLGTQSQNLPEAHQLISLFRMCLQVIAPGVILLAEAIVAPKNILKYFGEDGLEGNECEVAYNASLMALLWNSVATTKTSLLHKSLMEIPSKPKNATWINYIRCHDDIGLGYDDEFIWAMDWDPYNHRKFLLEYYTSNLAWTPARGMMFMYNPKNGDGRITGSTASLLGLEKGIYENNHTIIKTAVSKILMLHGIILSYGGIPLIYAGDEIGTLNDYSFKDNDDYKDDSRWVNRPIQDWGVVKQLTKRDTYNSQIFNGLQKMIKLRKALPLLADTNNLFIHPSANPHIFVFERKGLKNSVWVFSNFDKNLQAISIAWLQSVGFNLENNKDLISDLMILPDAYNNMQIAPYQHLWIVTE